MRYGQDRFALNDKTKMFKFSPFCGDKYKSRMPQ